MLLLIEDHRATTGEPGETERWLRGLRRVDPSDVIQEVYLDAKRQVRAYLLRNGATKSGVLPTLVTSPAGHNYFTFNDPYFRIILLRAMAWTMNESFDPFPREVTW